MKDIIIRTAKSYKEGLLKSSDPLKNPSSIFSRQYLLNMSKNLLLPEISILLSAEKIREQGLKAAREDDIDNSIILISNSRSMCIQDSLSNEAIISAETFQSAAEAFIQYKKGNYHNAYELLRKSLECSQILNDQYGYNMELRKLHLTRNIIRVYSFIDCYEQSTYLAGCMIKYIEGNREYWPSSLLGTWSKHNEITLQEKWWSMDEILGEFKIILTQPQDISLQIINKMDQSLFVIDDNNIFSKVHVWLAAIRAFINGDLLDFLNLADIFFIDGSPYLTQAWKEISSRFICICRDFLPGIVDDLNY